jgi:hypothetical protein
VPGVKTHTIVVRYCFADYQWNKEIVAKNDPADMEMIRVQFGVILERFANELVLIVGIVRLRFSGITVTGMERALRSLRNLNGQKLL